MKDKYDYMSWSSHEASSKSKAVDQPEKEIIFWTIPESSSPLEALEPPKQEVEGSNGTTLDPLSALEEPEPHLDICHDTRNVVVVNIYAYEMLFPKLPNDITDMR